jgi:hypothetical protein
MQLPRKVRLTQSGLRHAADTPNALQRLTTPSFGTQSRFRFPFRRSQL